MYTIPVFHFSSMPTFHELWDTCMEGHLTYTEAFFVAFEDVLARHGVVRLSSALLDTCAGSGSLDIELLKRGFDLATMDGDPGMLELFRKKLAAQNIAHQPKLAKWSELPTVFGDEKFDAMICCGNSLIYAGGYWNVDGVIDHEASMSGIREALSAFCARLKPGGILLVDKPMDDEEPVEELVARVCVGGADTYDVFFSVRFGESGLRRTAQILLRNRVTGEEIGTPNVACRLKDAELEELLHRAGFSFLERIVRGEHDRFPLWIAKT